MNHGLFEKNVIILSVAVLITVAIGGLVQLVNLRAWTGVGGLDFANGENFCRACVEHVCGSGAGT